MASKSITLVSESDEKIPIDKSSKKSCQPRKLPRRGKKCLNIAIEPYSNSNKKPKTGLALLLSQTFRKAMEAEQSTKVLLTRMMDTLLGKTNALCHTTGPHYLSTPSPQFCYPILQYHSCQYLNQMFLAVLQQLPSGFSGVFTAAAQVLTKMP